jgi:hypothetical protein
MWKEPPAMAKGSGRNNKLAGQIGEFLVCAELGRRGLIAAPFAGNVPAFDIVAADEACNTVAIQVKSTRSDNWPVGAKDWMDIELDQKTQAQKPGGPLLIENPGLIYVHVVIAELNGGKDQFFVLTKEQLQQVVITRYSSWMATINWRRPKRPDCWEVRYRVQDLEPYRENWSLITEKLTPE